MLNELGIDITGIFSSEKIMLSSIFKCICAVEVDQGDITLMLEDFGKMIKKIFEASIQHHSQDQLFDDMTAVVITRNQ